MQTAGKMDNIEKDVLPTPINDSGVKVTLTMDWQSHFVRKAVPGDGDCFFSAVNVCMKHQDRDWKHNKISLRKLALPHLRDEIFSFYGDKELRNEEFLRSTWEEMKMEHGLPGQYVDCELMMATARALNIDIQMHGESNWKFQVEGRTPLYSIHLLYCGTPTGLFRGDHYDALILKEEWKESEKAPPRSTGWKTVSKKNKNCPTMEDWDNLYEDLGIQEEMKEITVVRRGNTEPKTRSLTKNEIRLPWNNTNWGKAIKPRERRVKSKPGKTVPLSTASWVLSGTAGYKHFEKKAKSGVTRKTTSRSQKRKKWETEDKSGLYEELRRNPALL